MDVSLLQGTEKAGVRDRLCKRVVDGRARVGVIGLGYVGLPLAVAAAKGGYEVIGIDTDPGKIIDLTAGRSYLRHVGDAQIAELRQSGRLSAVGDFAAISELDVIAICVPTPLSAHREPDLSYITRTADLMAPHLRSGQLIVLESTTFPGTTLDVLRPRLERSGLVTGETLFLAYSPEREDPGNHSFNTSTIPKVVGGADSFTAEVACAFYRRFIQQTVPVSSTAVAEAVKLTENIFRAVNIALVNELKIIYGAMGIDIWEVIEAARTKPFGFLAFYPGPGLGGHCIPIDPFYLTWKAREYGISTRFIELAGEINTLMPCYVVDCLARALDARSGKGLNRAKVLVSGIAYKKNVDDTRESPALAIIDMLEKRGARVTYHDPYVPEIPRTRRFPHLAGRRSIDLASPEVGLQDAAVIVTDHDEVDHMALVAAVPLVVDTRNATRHVQCHRDRIIPA